MSIIQGNAHQASTRGFYPKVINGSLRFNDDDSAYLSRTPASAGNRKTWTLSFWVKRGTSDFSANQSVFSSATNYDDIRFNPNGTLLLVGGTSGCTIETTQLFRDVSSWYHFVVAFDTTQATASDRVKFYVNGEQITAFATATYPVLNRELDFNNTVLHAIGRRESTDNLYFDGYLADVHFIDGQALDADDFGELKNGVWVAKAPSVTYGTNGFYLDFANSADIGNDVSGEGNDWTPNNFTASDVVLDSPTDNFCTLNPLRSDEFTLSDGNLVATSNQPGDNRSLALSSFAPLTGQWYAEVTVVTVGAMMIGLYPTDSDQTQRLYESGENGISYYAANGNKYINGSATAYGSSYTTGDVIGIALDMDGGEVTFYKNNVSQGAISLTAGTIYNIGISAASTGACVARFNFGQQDFTYTPPSGFLALSTANLPDPAIDPAQGSSPEDYFNTVLYTGNGSTQSITVGFQPDFVWFKNRTTARHHAVYDAVRGATQNLTVSLTDAETTQSASLTSFDSDGFSIGSAVWLNQNTDSIVAWNWKANGSGVSNTDGTITSTVSANTESGFSIVSYTGTGASATVGHGLSAAPEFMIIKNRADATNWNVYTTVIDGSMDYIYLNLTTGAGNSSASVPTSSLLNLTASNDVNGSGDNMIAYCFHSVEGFSKFGSYTGNGNADGSFVYTGFQPSFIIVKRTNAAEDWFMYDNKRSASGGYNVLGERLKPNTADSGYTTSYVDFLSNGFKWRVSGTGQNGSGDSYIYMAFADDGGPFKYSRAR